MFRKKTATRRKAFLIDSNQNKRVATKKTRNRFLNFFAQFLHLKKLLRFFRGRFLLAFFVFSMAAFIAFALFSPYFEIKKITIERDSPQLDFVALEQALSVFYGRNLLFLQPEELEAELLPQFLEFRSVDFVEKWPDQIVVSVQVSPPFFTLFDVETAEFMVVSEDGVILADKPREDLPVLRIEKYNQDLQPGSQFTNRAILKKIAQAQAFIEKEFEIELKSMSYLPLARELHLTSSRGTVFWLDLEQEVVLQLQKINYAWDRLRLESAQPPSHVDLRVPNNILYE
jgi:cell division septal protein FtsQ